MSKKTTKSSLNSRAIFDFDPTETVLVQYPLLGNYDLDLSEAQLKFIVYRFHIASPVFVKPEAERTALAALCADCEERDALEWLRLASFQQAAGIFMRLLFPEAWEDYISISMYC